MANWPKKLKTGRIRFNLDNVKSFVEGVEGLNKLSMEVGVLQGDKKPSAYKGKISLKELALIHEYGATIPHSSGKVIKIPARSFLRSSLKSARYDIIPEMQQSLINTAIGSQHKTFIGAARVKKIALKLLDKLGKDMQFLIKSKILNHIPPPLAGVTIKKKLKDKLPLPYTPLIATGTLYQHINYRVRDAGKFAGKG